MMETTTEELNIRRFEHSNILVAAAMNPKLIGSSRFSGRQSSATYDWPNPPTKEYGQMWELSVNKWMDRGTVVPYYFLKFIQTTAATKVAVYEILLAKGKEAA